MVKSRGCSAHCTYWNVNYFGVICALAMARAVVVGQSPTYMEGEGWVSRVYPDLDHSCYKYCDLIGQSRWYTSHITLISSHITLVKSHTVIREIFVSKNFRPLNFLVKKFSYVIGQSRWYTSHITLINSHITLVKSHTVIRENFVSKNFRPLNFHVKKFSYRRPTSYCSNMHTLYTAMKKIVHLIFVHNRAYEKFLTTKISQLRYNTCNILINTCRFYHGTYIKTNQITVFIALL